MSRPSLDATTVVVRPEPYDSPMVRALVDAMIADIEERYASTGEADDPEAEWALDSDDVTPPRGVFLVAYLDAEAVGCGAIRPLPSAGPHVAEVKRMYTTPRARRRGASRAILRRLETEALRLGYRRLQLETGLRQPEAIALYESAGYQRIANYGYYASSPLSMCFAKDL
jgi:GNAT superfamily N-acetyltransferase